MDLRDRRTVRMLLVMLVMFGIATTHLAGVTEQAFGMQYRDVSAYVVGMCGAIVLFCCAAQVAARIQAAGARCGLSSVQVNMTSTNCCEDLGQAPYFLAGAAPLFLLCVPPWALGCAIGSFRGRGCGPRYAGSGGKFLPVVHGAGRAEGLAVLAALF